MTKKIVTHDSRFHADDVFATATLLLFLGEKNTTIVRSREQEIVDSGDYVFDVGNVYDPSTNRFDHHQEGGAGIRENGVPYAAFGLVWKAYGGQVCGSQKVADEIETLLVQPIDARDNGLEICEPIFVGVHPYSVGKMVSSFAPTWEETGSYNDGFFKALEFAKTILANEIKAAQSREKGRAVVEEAYKKAVDKRLIIMPEEPALDRDAVANVVCDFPEALYVVKYRRTDNVWQVTCVREDVYTFKNKKPLPEEWAGKRDEELAKITGVSDAFFCHNGRFMALARSREGAVKLAELALKN